MMTTPGDQRSTLLDHAVGETVEFSDAQWRDLPPTRAVDALRGLVETVAAIHGAHMELDGIGRDDLAIDVDRARLLLVDAPRMRPADPVEPESIWRDARLVGQLAYENLMGEDYPGSHHLAALLQERKAMAETGLLEAGLTQVVAACVSPYGELALVSMADLDRALEQLRRELQPPLTLTVGSRSTVGNYIFRRNNQDSCGHLITQTMTGSARRTVGFFCVADGIGGIQDGEQASRLAVESACLAFGRAASHYGADVIAEQPGAVARAVAKATSQRLALEGEFNPSHNRGGTTFTGLVIGQDRAGIGHVGDSRAVLVRDGDLVRLTRDHTLGNILERLGQQAVSDTRAEMSQRTLSRFLSTGIEIEADRIDGVGPRAHALATDADIDIDTVGFQVHPGDMFVLTSDGVHDECPQPRIKQLVELHRREPQALANALVQSALSTVGRDNATAMTVLVE